MIIIDKALEKRQESGNPIRVAMLGAGFMGRGIALQIINVVSGMELVAISNRHLAGAIRAYQKAGIESIQTVESVAQVEDSIRKGRPAVTEDPLILCQAENIDAVLEVTGDVEFGAKVALEAIHNGKHFITLNAELDGTVGPILKVYADKAGIIYTVSDGDQPGVTMNLYRFVKGIGIKPVLCGNIKGLHDPYRNPTTQEGFAKKWGQNPQMVTSFADGSKISYEQAIVANATGMQVAKRGMYGFTVPEGTPFQEAARLFPLEDLLEGPGIVDYLVGVYPAPGVFVFGTHDDPAQQHYLNLYKLGSGPLYGFYRPYHLCHFEVHNSIARAVLFADATLAPLGPPKVEVVATAKIDLKAGDVLDGIGCYMTYGECENIEVSRSENLLPIGVAEGCRLIRDIPKDQALTYADVVLPEGRLIEKLREEQSAYFEVALAKTGTNEI
jgi:predicted homoserine dehydrogenase-like protein